MRKVMVTGGAGFIGSHLVDALLEEGFEVIVVDNESSCCNEEYFYNENATNIKLDISKDVKELDLAMKGVSVVFHLAAESKQQWSISCPDETYQTNIIGTANLLNLSHKHRINKFILSSCCSVYGNKNNTPLKEDMHRDCINPYSASKSASEELCKMYYRFHDLDTIILRYFNVYGERMPSDPRYASAVSVFKNQKGEERPLTLTGSGDQIRDFVYVGDVVDANIKALSVAQYHCPGEVINIGSGKGTSILELANMIDLHSKKEVVRPSGEVDESVADILKARMLLNWRPKQDLRGWIDGR